MPEIHKDDFVCFVHGHGAKYSSTPAEKAVEMRQRPFSAPALEFARKLAAAQLVFQRAAGKQLLEK